MKANFHQRLEIQGRYNRIKTELSDELDPFTSSDDDMPASKVQKTHEDEEF